MHKVPLTVQRDLMRHADIRTTAQVYGDVWMEELRKANTEMAKRVIFELSNRGPVTESIFLQPPWVKRTHKHLLTCDLGQLAKAGIAGRAGPPQARNTHDNTYREKKERRPRHKMLEHVVHCAGAEGAHFLANHRILDFRESCIPRFIPLQLLYRALRSSHEGCHEHSE